MADRLKLKKSGVTVNASELQPERMFAGGSQNIIEVKEESWGQYILGWAKSIVLYFILLAALLAVVYTGLAATVVNVAQVDNRVTLVARGTFVGGIPDQNDLLYISDSTPKDTSILNNIKIGYLGAPDASVVRVKSTQYSKVEVTSTMIKVDDRELSTTGFVDKNGKEATGSFKLNDQYLVQCVAGNCAVGKAYIIDANQIYGEVKNTSK